MRKLILAIMIMISGVCYAKDSKIARYKGFPLYPVSTVEEYQNKNVAHIKVPLGAYGFVDDAKRYVFHSAKKCGWSVVKESIEEPLTYVFVQGIDPSRIVKVIFNREMNIEGVKGDDSYFESVEGSVEYIFKQKDVVSQYRVKKIVTTARNKAVDAYVKLLKKESFDVIAAEYSEVEIIEDTIQAVIDPDTIILKEVMRLMPGQTTDIFRSKDGLFLYH